MNDNNFGILSLSEVPDSSLMWESYAVNGTGFLIELDPNHPWFWSKKEDSDDLRHLRRVNYVSNRQEAYLLDLSGQDYLYTKGTKWEYECEWRIIRNFNDSACLAGKDDKETDILLFAIPPNCIISVAAGYNTTPGFKKQLQSAISAIPVLSHVSFKVATLEQNGAIQILADWR